MTDERATLVGRLEQLEREVRWWRLVSCGAVAGLALLAFIGAAPAKVPDEIRAKRFVVIDDGGKERAFLGQKMLRTQGQPIPVGFYLYGEDSQPRITLADEDDGGPKVALMARGAKEPQVWLHAARDGAAVLSVSRKAGKGKATMYVSADGASHVSLEDSGGRLRAVLGYTALAAVRGGTGEIRPASSLVLFDREGKPLWKAP